MRIWQRQQWQLRTRRLYFLFAVMICGGVWSALAESIANVEAVQTTATPVPSITPTGYVPAQDQFTPIVTKAVFQQFETGWMLWREDDNYVYVFMTSNWVQSYPLTELESTFVNTPTALTMPPDREPTDDTFRALWRADRWGIAPIIGWATDPAVSYQATIFTEDEYGFEINIPDGEHIRLVLYARWHLGGVSGGTWAVSGAQPTFVAVSFPTPIPTPLPTPLVTQAIYQEFEHGFMLTRVDSNCAYAYSYTTKPEGNIVITQEISAKPFGYYTYCLDFSTLPDVLIVEATPTGLQAPIGKLGKVWRYYQEVRSALGYATAPEQLYLADIPFHACTDEFSCSYMPPILALPDGRVLSCGMRAASGGKCVVR